MWITDQDFTQLSDKVATISWFIWKHRCSVVFEKIISNPIHFMEQIKKFLNQNTQARIQSLMKIEKRNNPKEKWSDLSSDWIIFIDAAFKKEDSAMGYAFLLYSVDTETFMYIEAGSEWASSAFHAKSKDLLKASSWLSKNILSTVLIVTDCKTLAETINKSCKDSPWTADNTIQEVNSILKKLPQAQVKYINRKYNSAADHIAKEARVKHLRHMFSHIQHRILNLVLFPMFLIKMRF